MGMGGAKESLFGAPGQKQKISFSCRSRSSGKKEKRVDEEENNREYERWEADA